MEQYTNVSLLQTAQFFFFKLNISHTDKESNKAYK
jgi:hypothetical protein